ncbi:MAG: DNA translocase FtsK [Chloroflexi bacterium]|nr:DNA translocase FtsK [Chloroflexota bacterium]
MAVLSRILTSPSTRPLFAFFLAAGLIMGFWHQLLRALGAGVILPIAVSLLVILLLLLRRVPSFLRPWNRWLGISAFAAALLGILAFFNPTGYPGYSGGFSGGGYGGLAIIRDQDTVGVLIVIGLLLVGLACVAPRFSWRAYCAGGRAIKRGAERVAPVLQRLLQRLGEWGRGVMDRLRQRWGKHPSGEATASGVKKRPTPSRPETGAGVGKETASGAGRRGEAGKGATGQLALPLLGRWQLPSIELLNETAGAELARGEVEKRARMIEEALASYGVEARVVQMNVGPAVTQFGVEPGWDRKIKEVKKKDRNGNVVVKPEEISRTRVKVERITSLANDLALALAAPSIRIEAPVPGTSLVGIEVPNSAMGTVSVREVLENTAFQKISSRSKLAIALGKGTAGEVVAADLAKMPHLLIAGATGSGKTVCLNSIILSLLMHNIPDEMRFVMIDPKRVELTAFNGIPHLSTPVVIEGDKAVDILKWLEHEMDSRYRRLASVGSQNIERYNKSGKVPKQMPFLVVVIDELADLMLARADDVEPLLCRLAQMGRAVGIHLIVATQRPSVDVITGLIKANFPTRISFAVVSQVDSRTILDAVGAEKLLGRGDMLYLPTDAAKPKRLQGCLTTPEEMERVVKFWREQARLQAVEIFAVGPEEVSGEDPLLEEARRLAKEHKQISLSFLQRQLRIGLSRAERLMQQLQSEGLGEPDQPKEP